MATDSKHLLVPGGVVTCVRCGKHEKLERLGPLEPSTIPPGSPWRYPKGWLYGIEGWFCCVAHVGPLK